MNLLQILKQRNRTVLEMEIGILFCGILAQGIGAFLVKNQWYYAKSLWFGILLALAATHHMYRTMDRALDFDEKSATKLIFQGYIIRYVILVAFILAIIFTKVMNPLVVYGAYMSLKVTVYLQPSTHKLCNKIFHETDPIPEPIVDEPPCEDGTEEQMLQK